MEIEGLFKTTVIIKNQLHKNINVQIQVEFQL